MTGRAKESFYSGERSHEWKWFPLVQQAATIVGDIQRNPRRYMFKPEDSGFYYLDTFISYENPITSIQITTLIAKFEDAKNRYAVKSVFTDLPDQSSTVAVPPQLTFIRTHEDEEGIQLQTELAFGVKRRFWKRKLEPMDSQSEDQDTKLVGLLEYLTEIRPSGAAVRIEATLKDGRSGPIELLPEYR